MATVCENQFSWLCDKRVTINKKLKGVDCPKYKANDIPNGIYIVLFGL